MSIVARDVGSISLIVIIFDHIISISNGGFNKTLNVQVGVVNMFL